MRKLNIPAGRVLRKGTIPVLLLIAHSLFPQWAGSQSSGDLEQVLSQMDTASTRFRSTEASFTWIQYNKVIDDIADTQKGKIYFRRTGRDIEMAANITEPDTKLLVFSGGKIQVYQPRIDQEDD